MGGKAPSPSFNFVFVFSFLDADDFVVTTLLTVFVTIFFVVSLWVTLLIRTCVGEADGGCGLLLIFPLRGETEPA